MEPIKIVKISSVILKQYEEGVVLQKGKDIIFLNNSQAKDVLEVFEQLNLLSEA